MEPLSLHSLLELIELPITDYSRSENFEFKAILSPEECLTGGLTFISDEKYADKLSESKAAALITAKKREQFSGLQIIHPNPYWAFAKVADYFYEPDHGEELVHPKAFVDSTAKIGKGVRIFPNAYVGKNVVVGDGAVIYPGVYLGNGSEIGSCSVLYANVVIEHGCKIGNDCILHAGSAIGADGFGFAPKPPSKSDKGEIVKIPQIGDVVIEDHVEIGALCTIDRGAMGSTRIGRGTKLDDKVHIGHNCIVGENSIICGMVAMAGSAKIGNWVVLAGQVGINGHISIADGVTVGGGAGVTKTIKEPGGKYLGFPAYEAREWKKDQVRLRRLLKNTKR